MDNIYKYSEVIGGISKKIAEEESENIRKASILLADVITKDRLINVFGPGSHSHMFVDEMFFRAGGLAPIRPWLNPAIARTENIYTVLFCEETPGFGKALIKEHVLDSDDVIIIANPNGINCCAIEVALECKKIGMKVIGVTSRSFSESVPLDFYARHPSKKNLCDVVDISIDLKQPPGDAVIEVERCPQKIAPVSGVGQLVIANMIVIAVTEELISRGIEPPVFRSGHIPNGKEFNERHVRDLYKKM
jgi:uncharacterized phosphosugar-binding protein